MPVPSVFPISDEVFLIYFFLIVCLKQNITYDDREHGPLVTWAAALALHSAGKINNSHWNPTHPCGPLLLGLLWTISEQHDLRPTDKTLRQYRRKSYVVTYQPSFTGNQQHFSTQTLSNFCFLQKSAVSSHHNNCFVLYYNSRNFRRIAEYRRSQVFQRPESLQREEQKESSLITHSYLEDWLTHFLIWGLPQKGITERSHTFSNITLGQWFLQPTVLKEVCSCA